MLETVDVLGCGCVSQRDKAVPAALYECALHGLCATIGTALVDGADYIHLCQTCPDRPRR